MCPSNHLTVLYRGFLQQQCEKRSGQKILRRSDIWLRKNIPTTQSSFRGTAESDQSVTTISSPSSRSESRRTSAIPLMLAMGKTTMNKNDTKIDIDGEGRKEEEEVPACNILSIDIRLSPSSEWWGPGKGGAGHVVDRLLHVSAWQLRAGHVLGPSIMIYVFRRWSIPLNSCNMLRNSVASPRPYGCFSWYFVCPNPPDNYISTLPSSLPPVNPFELNREADEFFAPTVRN